MKRAIEVLLVVLPELCAVSVDYRLDFCFFLVRTLL